MKLISQLKQEHMEIMRSFNDLKEEISLKKMETCLDELIVLKEILLFHLKLEDKMLYPELKKVEGDVRKTSDKFSKEMIEISKEALNFFNKYEKVSISNLIDNLEFKREFENLYNLILKRIKIEEKILYPLYEEYCEK